jgi:formamidopyrimidine-DNA glycosylase
VPELPDVTVYVEAIERRALGTTLERVRLFHPFVLRSVEPPLTAVHGRRVDGVRRIGKRIAVALDGALFVVIHLMIAGRLEWRPPGARGPGRIGLVALDFSTGTLLLTEAGTKRRASLRVVQGEDALHDLDPGGLEVLDADREAFQEAITRENHTLKRALTDPGILAGIGNAYSDEILHRARLSPLALTSKLDAGEVERLHAAAVAVLHEWTERLREQAGNVFPEKVTAFRPEMAVHGRYGQPCPVCGSPVQRIVYAENECNYCATCQTGGRVLADRALSRLLHDSWPRSIDELG